MLKELFSLVKEILSYGARDAAEEIYHYRVVPIIKEKLKNRKK